MEPTRVIIEKQDQNGMAVAALVLGIVGLVLGLMPIFGWFMLPVWILAIIFGYLGRKKEIKQGFATTGMVLGAVTFIFKIGFWILLLISAATGSY